MGKKRVKTETEAEVLEKKDKMDSVIRKAQVKEAKKKLTKAFVYIQSSYNNTLISFTDLEGNVIAWASAGSVGFKGTRKSTPFAASRVAEVLAEKLKKTGLEEIAVFVKGIGSGRDSAIRSLASHGLNITSIRDITPIPHNGCRPPKVRRV